MPISIKITGTYNHHKLKLTYKNILKNQINQKTNDKKLLAELSLV